MAERIEDLVCLQTQIAERERALPLCERIKAIFQKYGVTVSSVLYTAGVTIAAVIGALTNSLKATSKDFGNALKDIGKQIASLLPDLIGWIVSYLFKAAGKAVDFLAGHTWLLIEAVVAFLVEKIHQKAAMINEKWTSNGHVYVWTRNSDANNC